LVEKLNNISVIQKDKIGLKIFERTNMRKWVGSLS